MYKAIFEWDEWEKGQKAIWEKQLGIFTTGRKKIKLQIKEDLQNQEGDIKGPLHQVTSLKPAENQQQTNV